MKFARKEWNVIFNISKEVIKTVARETHQNKDDIIYDLLNLLDKKFTDDNFKKLARRKRQFGTYKVIECKGIKIKCVIGMRSDNKWQWNPKINKEENLGDPATWTCYIKMTPATGQWLVMEGKDLRNFIEKKETQITESVLFDQDLPSVEVQDSRHWLQRQRQDRNAPSEQKSQSSSDACAPSAQTSTSQASACLSHHGTDSLKLCETDEDSPFS